MSSGPHGGDPVAVAAGILGDRARIGMPLGPLTTYRVGGRAAIGIVARSVADLRLAAAAIAASGLPVLVIGRGSNLLVADAGFAGLAVTFDAEAFGAFDIDAARSVVRAGAALPLPALARRSVDAGWQGLEWAVGVPGSVGGGVRMNAGGHGSDIAATFVRARIVDLGLGATAGEGDIGPAELALGYRRSSLRSDQVVTSAEFRLEAGDPAAGRETIREIVRWRREHQPGGQNAGSVFVNPRPRVRPSPDPGRAAAPDAPARPTAAGPTAVAGSAAPGPTAVAGSAAAGAVGPGPAVTEPPVSRSVISEPAGPGDDSPPDPMTRSAGWLIEAAGCKGLRIGSAQVSTKHANFIQADPDGSADDVRALMAAVQGRVRAQWGVILRTEIRLVGFESDCLVEV